MRALYERVMQTADLLESAVLRAQLAKKEHVIAQLSEELIDATKEAGPP
ncbi:MAG TPA: hypothetical protein PKI03_02455 [Pseudomonadota bacterium]|nr:hypothetical protein [Pseudomonadota bacterium]